MFDYSDIKLVNEEYGYEIRFRIILQHKNTRKCDKQNTNSEPLNDIDNHHQIRVI